jgi:uncharacterized protein (TIGR02996 family)
MTQDDAFLQAIIESPDDESLRLIYADWLDERGDPRGEFIRVQVTLANSPDQPRRQELEARQRDLLGRHEQQWVTPLRPWVNAWAFQRGFVEDIKAQLDTVLANAEKLFGAAPLRSVTFLPPEYKGPVKHVTFPPVFVEPLHRRLEAACPYLARLSAIDWAHTQQIGDLGLAALANSPMPFRLSRLDLTCASIGDTGVQALAGSSAFPHLTALNLPRNPLGCLAAESLATSEFITHLAELNLSHTRIGDQGVEVLAASPNLNNLTDLHLAGTAFGNMAARALAGSPYLANLKRLDFRWSRFGRKARHTLRERFGDIVQW